MPTGPPVTVRAVLKFARREPSAVLLAAQLVSLLIYPFLENGDAAPRMTASFGVAGFVAGAEAHELVRAADEALYEAKRRGKNRVRAAAETAVAEA